jgi:ketosteroid isomerase-like protein
MPAKKEVIQTALDLISAFAKNDRKSYFSYFTPDANFIFYSVNRVLESRAAYEDEWETWIKNDGFHVEECISINHRVKIYGDVAVFSHDTRTRVSTNDGKHSYNEKETIVFHKVEGKWLGVHEHLSLLST